MCMRVCVRIEEVIERLCYVLVHVCIMRIHVFMCAELDVFCVFPVAYLPRALCCLNLIQILAFNLQQGSTFTAHYSK